MRYFLLSFPVFLTPTSLLFLLVSVFLDLSNSIVRSFLALRVDLSQQIRALDGIIFKINPFNSVCFYELQITVSALVFSFRL